MKMREKLQRWNIKGLRDILRVVRTTLVDVMLGEVGMKRVEYELDGGVERWGRRLVRRDFRERFGEGWKKEIEW